MWRTIRDELVLGIIGILFFASVIQVLNVTAYSAEATVSRYLSALEEGRLEDAAAIALPGSPISSVIPLPASPNLRPHNAVITGSVVEDGVTTVNATVLLGDDTVPVQFRLTQGSHWSPLHTWEFVQPPVAVVDVVVDPAGLPSLNGRAANHSRRVLVPQIVTVDSATDWFSTKPITVTVSEAGSLNSAAVTFTPTRALISAMDTSIRAYLDDCAASVSLVPAQCPFAAFTFDSVAVGPVWSVDTYPEIDITATDTGWAVSGSGTVTLSVSLVDFATESTTAYTEKIPFTIEGTISGLDTARPQLTVSNTVER